MNVVFFGTPDFVTHVLDGLAKDHKVTGIVTAPDSIEGRKKILTPSPVKKFGEEYLPDAKFFTPDKFDTTITFDLEALNPDIFVVAAYGKILPKNILDIPKFGSVNIHPSLLPKYRGPSPIQSAILGGESVTGVTIIKMDEEVDHGPLIAQWDTPISDEDTFMSLHSVMFKQAAIKLPKILDSYVDGKVSLKIQNEDEATYCLKITREDGFVELTKSVDVDALQRKIRAFYPWPTAWIKLDKDYGGQAKKDAILKLLPENKVQLEGKNPVSKKDFLNGYPQSKEIFDKLGM